MNKYESFIFNKLKLITIGQLKNIIRLANLELARREFQHDRGIEL